MNGSNGNSNGDGAGSGANGGSTMVELRGVTKRFGACRRRCQPRHPHR